LLRDLAAAATARFSRASHFHLRESISPSLKDGACFTVHH
jgi:hypothetical protein